MISNLPPSSTAAGAGTAPALETFQQAARQGEWLHISRDGSQWQVKAVGATPSQRTVTWVEPQADTTSAFIEALGQSFSRGIQSAVAHELGLQPAPGRPLAARTVMQAIDMAQTSHTALQGVDFMARLNVSAVHGAAEFVHACQAIGLDPDSIGVQQRLEIDARLGQRFDSAASQRQGPVSDHLAREWLHQELRMLNR